MTSQAMLRVPLSLSIVFTLAWAQSNITGFTTNSSFEWTTEESPIATIDYCTEGASLEALNQEGCSSCHQRCNQTCTLEEAYCSCDSSCLVYEDCCWDFYLECPASHAAALELQALFPEPLHASCLPLTEHAYLIISHCGNNASTCESRLFSVPPDPELGVLVRDLDTGIVYVNYRCALCNGATAVEALPVSLSCDGERVERGQTMAPPIDADVDTGTVLNNSLSFGEGCETVYLVDDVGLRECAPVINTCPDSCDNIDLSLMCEHGAQAYTQITPHAEVYRNVYCTMCNVGTFEGNCTHIQFNQSGFFIRNPAGEGVFSLSLLFDFSSEDGARVGSVTVHCDPDEVVMPAGTACGEVVCPVGYTRDGGVCIKQNVTGNATVGNHTLCAGVRLDDTAYTITNDTLLLHSTGDVYQSSEYISEDGSVILCYEESEFGGSFELFETSDGMGILTIVLSTLSLACLCTRIALQGTKSRKYHTAPGRIQCQLAVAMALALVFLLLSPLAADQHDVCAVLAAFKYMTFLSAFGWMSCVAGDAWWAMRASQSCVQENPHHTVLRYALIAWLCPIVLASVVYSLDFTDIPASDRPSFGGGACWFTSRTALLYYFFVPVVICMTLNLIFFILTSCGLRKAFQNSAQVRKNSNANSFADRVRQQSVYVKLFILMGLTWLFGFLAAWVDTDAVWYIFIVLNASQGIYFFLGFVLDWRQAKRFVSGTWTRYRDTSATHSTSRSTERTSVSKEISVADAKKRNSSGSTMSTQDSHM